MHTSITGLLYSTHQQHNGFHLIHHVLLLGHMQVLAQVRGGSAHELAFSMLLSLALIPAAQQLVADQGEVQQLVQVRLKYLLLYSLEACRGVTSCSWHTIGIKPRLDAHSLPHAKHVCCGVEIAAALSFRDSVL
jgi:hypothetical protein